MAWGNILERFQYLLWIPSYREALLELPGTFSGDSHGGGIGLHDDTAGTEAPTLWDSTGRVGRAGSGENPCGSTGKPTLS